MTIERAIQILDPEHREHYDSIETVNEACRMGMAALRAQQEAEKNEPLEMDELWGMDGDTDKIQILMLKGAGEWKNVDAANGSALLFGIGGLRFEDYGKTWFAYRRPPEEEE